MSVNVGSVDRLIRAVLGLILIVLPFISGWGAVGMITSLVIGAVLLATALFRFCPLYRLLGVRTCQV